ncbi:MAG: metal-dependent transcriptional regulator, partial [Polaribacter sp.]|nr:metal-dependent transcriptional regulator [Polaribacter sp.]
LLGFPKQDPHGDPIPDKEGNYYPLEKKLLATLGLGEKGICVGVNDSSSSFLQFLDKQKIALGNEIKVLGKEPFDDSIQIQIANRELSISNKIANNLYIKIL